MTSFSSSRLSVRSGLVLVALVLLVLVPYSATGQEIVVDPSISTPTDFVFTVDIAIACGGQAVKGVEVKLAFDPFLLQLDGVSPGPWYTGTGQDFFFFDYTPVDPQGTIHFASSVLAGDNDQDLVIATCHFSALGFGTTPLIFQDVDVRSPDNADLGFGHSVGDLVIVDPAIPVTASTFGGVKALFR